MTGRAAGYCAGYGVPGYMNAAGGRGFGFGRGFGRGGGWGGGGRGWRNWFYATGLTGWQRAAGLGWPAAPAAPPPVSPAITPQQEVEMLRAHLQQTEEALGQLKRRLEELESGRVEKTGQ